MYLLMQHTDSSMCYLAVIEAWPQVVVSSLNAHQNTNRRSGLTKAIHISYCLY
uniref:Uncharacterized protein n=1 Tax=Arundo donax TaxID=35708 RepID=A0A0A8YFG3_ARUDO